MPAEAEGDAARRELGEVVGGRDDVGGDVGGEGGEAEREEGADEDDGVFEAGEDVDGIPERPAVDDGRGGGDGDSDK